MENWNERIRYWAKFETQRKKVMFASPTSCFRYVFKGLTTRRQSKHKDKNAFTKAEPFIFCFFSVYRSQNPFTMTG